MKIVNVIAQLKALSNKESVLRRVIVYEALLLLALFLLLGTLIELSL
ncbi:MAG: hypothetical protein U0Y10_27415 [Spirosomataceae bacterium]